MLAVGESNFATYKLILMSKNLNFTSGFSGNIIMLRRSGAAAVPVYMDACAILHCDERWGGVEQTLCNARRT